MLKRVVRRVPDVGLRIDEEPRLPFRGEHILSVKVGAEQRLAVRRRRKAAEEAYAFPSQAGIQAALSSCEFHLELIRPLVAHSLQRTEGMLRWGRNPSPSKQVGDDHVLFFLWSRS